MRLNLRSGTMEVKFLVHGPDHSGRRTNLRHLGDTVSGTGTVWRSSLVGPDITGRGPAIHHLDVDMGLIGRHKVRLRCLSLPSDTGLARLRRVALQGIDGVVFVADSARDRGIDNITALQHLHEALEGAGRSLSELPHVFQWNKRDLRSPLPVGVLERDLNPQGADSIPAIAKSGVGVWRTWRRLVERVIDGLGAPGTVGA